MGRMDFKWKSPFNGSANETSTWYSYTEFLTFLEHWSKWNMWKHGSSCTSALAKVTMLISVDACLQTIRNLSQGHNTAISQENLNDQYGVGKKVHFQPGNTDRGAHLPLEANWDRLTFRCVGLATPPPQRACYLPRIAGTHLYTWVERSNYG